MKSEKKYNDYQFILLNRFFYWFNNIEGGINITLGKSDNIFQKYLYKNRLIKIITKHFY